LRSDKFPPKGHSKSEGEGGASSAFLYAIAGGDARLLTYFTCFSRRWLSILWVQGPRPSQGRSLIQEALIILPFL